ncbi:MAG: hypothetical protein QXG05_03135 [Nitrososphaerota archaeon]
MRASRIMLLEYIAMLGVPVLLLIEVILTPFQGIAALRTAIIILIALGSVIYGAIGLRDVYIRGGRSE